MNDDAQPITPAAVETDSTSDNSRSPAALSAFHAELLSRVWQQSLPMMRERVAVLLEAAQLAAQEKLSPEARTEAADLAHKLAGSLGMFGFPRGTEIARDMETILEGQGLPDGSRLSLLAQQLRAALPL